MPTITASMVKELRERTDVAMMKCKKALEECDGDMEAAVEFLRKTAGAAMDKKAGRETNAGGIGLATEGGVGVLVLLACETDFVSGNEQFKSFASDLAQVAARGGAGDVAALQALSIGGQSVAEVTAQQVQKLGENIRIIDLARLEAEVVSGYNHGGRVATLVAGSGDGEVLRAIAMHVAAANPAPLSLDRDGVPAETVEQERRIISESPDVQAKPENIRPKIIDGKLSRFYKENVLLEQEMLVDNADGQTVGKWAAAKGASLSDFRRFDV